MLTDTTGLLDLESMDVPLSDELEMQNKLSLYTPFSAGMQFVRHLENNVANYKHIIRLHGGYWTASWEIIGMTPEAKRQFFRRHLAYHFEEAQGALTTWVGLIWEMDLSWKGVTRRISLGNVRNKVKCNYTDTGGASRYTPWYTHDDSIARFGEIQEVLYLDGVTKAVAKKYAQTFLLENALPRAMVVSTGELPMASTTPSRRKTVADYETVLYVTAVGYIYTANYRYSISTGQEDISDHISNEITNNCPQIEVGSIKTNTEEVLAPDSPIRVWDWISQLTAIGDGTQPYASLVVNGRKFNYSPISNQPYLHWSEGGLRTSLTSPTRGYNKWSLLPVVMRDWTWEAQPLRGTFLTDARDVLVTEIEVSQGSQMPSLKTEEYDESDFLTAFAGRKLKGGYRLMPKGMYEED